MNWKTAYRSFYYAKAEEPDDIHLNPAATVLFVIDIQNTDIEPTETPGENALWQPFFDRMKNTIVPNTKKLIDDRRAKGVEIIYARIACHKLTAGTARSTGKSWLQLCPPAEGRGGTPDRSRTRPRSQRNHHRSHGQRAHRHSELSSDRRL